MRILYVHRTQASGVEGVHIRQLVGGLRRLGHTVDFLSPVGDFNDGDEPQGSAAESGAGWKRKLLGTMSRALPEFAFELAELSYNFLALREARLRFDRDSVDAIYERYAILSIVGARLAQRWKKPFVLEVNYTSQSPLVRKRSALLAPLARRLDRYVFARASALAVVSSHLKWHLVKDYAVPEAKIAVVPNAADPDQFDPDQPRPSDVGAGNQDKIVGFVGGFYPWHGLDLLVHAFRTVAARVTDARLVLIGDGPMRPAIAGLVSSLGLDDRVVMPGSVPHDALGAHLCHFDVGVMPDSNAYGSPMKVFEYMAMGKPVVVPDYPPLRDVIIDGVEGRVFPPGDAPALAECLEQLLTDSALRETMGRNAREKIVSTHNWLNNAKTVESLLAA